MDDAMTCIALVRAGLGGQHGAAIALKTPCKSMSVASPVLTSKKEVFPVISPILQRLNLDQSTWLEITTQFEKLFFRKFGCRRQRHADTG